MVSYYKVSCSKLSCGVGVVVHGRLDVKDGCPWKGYRGISWCPGCLPGEAVEDSLIAISLEEYDKVGKRFPDIF